MSWKKGLFVFAILGFVCSAVSYKIDVTTLDPYFEEETTEPFTTTELFTTTEPITSTESFTINEDGSTNITIPNYFGFALFSLGSKEEPGEGIEKGVSAVALNPKLRTRFLTHLPTPPAGAIHPLTIVNVGKGQADVHPILFAYFVWVNTTFRQLLLPGETKTFRPTSAKSQYAYEIINPSNTRVILFASRSDVKDGYSTVNNDYKEPIYNFNKFALKVGRQILIKTAGLVPDVGPALSFLIGAIWPEEKEKDPWEERLQIVKKMMDDVLYEAISDNLERTLAAYRYDIQDLSDNLNNPDTNYFYMQLFSKIKSYPDFFSCQESKQHPSSCFPTLPIYTELINTNMAVYNWGVRYAEKLNLTDTNVRNIIETRKKMVARAIKYIQHQYDERIEYVYNTCHPDEFYNSIMDVRRFVSLSALEYISHWKNMADPNSKVDYNVMTYSSFYGIASPALYMQAFLMFGSEPLTPGMVITNSDELRRKRLAEIQINYNNNGFDINGIMLTFQYDYTMLLGSQTLLRSKPLKMRNRVIQYLDVSFRGKIECLKFHMSDGETVSFGKCSGRGSNKRFQLDDHYIASLFVANDIPYLEGALANIAVSYQQYRMRK